MVSQRISHYLIQEKLGAGGMGEVYRAQDEVLKRPVAIKLLPAAVAADRTRRERFLAEAQAASALNHPGITTIYEIGEEGGRTFLVMEYVEGQNVRRAMESGDWDLRKTLDVALSAAEALAAAHERGIVHRDIKPDNIMVTPSGTAKILDFGLAKLREPAGADLATQATVDVPTPLTEPGVVMGTVGYMSPEQLTPPSAGGKVDHRSDIFAFGLVLYEMATGRQAFTGKTSVDVMHAILHQELSSPAETNPQLPQELCRIIEKATRKDPEERYQSARDLAADLRHLKRETQSGAMRVSTQAWRPRRESRKWMAAALVLAVLAVALGWWLWRGRVPRRGGGTGRPAVAVLYFRNLTQDPTLNWLDSGLTEMLTTNLSQVQGIDVLSTERVMSALQRMGKREGSELSPAVALEVARHAGADAFVTGALLRVGPTRLRLDVRVQDTGGGQILFSEKLEGEDAQSVFSMVDSLTQRIAERFLPASKLPEKAPAIEEAATSNLEAYRHYQLGRDYQRRFLLSESIRELEEAVRLDPQFALAYWFLGGAYVQQGDLKKSGELWQKAEPLQSRLPRKEQLRFQATKAARAGDQEAQLRALESLLGEFPRETAVRANVARQYLNLNQPERAASVLREGLAADPKDEDLLNLLCYTLAQAGNLAGALEANDKYQAVRPGDPNPWDTRGDVLYIFGRHDQAVAAYRKVLELKPDFIGYLPYLKMALAYADQKKFALAESALEEYGKRTTPLGKLYLPVFEGQLKETRGDLEGALQSYRKAVTQLGRAGQNPGAGDALGSFAAVSIFLGDVPAALSFARQQKLLGYEYPAISSLEAARGDQAAAERSVQQLGATLPWIGAKGLEQLRAGNEMYAALLRNDGSGVLAAAGRLPQFEFGLILFAKGRAHTLLKDNALAEQELRRALAAERRTMSNFNILRIRSPLREMLCRFYLAQVYETTGKREQAVNEYQEFLSHFEKSTTRLPEVAEARAALKRLLP